VDVDAARGRLLDERERLQSLIRELDGELGESEQDASDELSSVDQHPADTASDTFEREKDDAIRGSLERELEEVDAALARIDAGTYGIDEETGAPIADARLEALPTARTNIR
jgi:RNA polymerase-binding transcription factor DksA